MNLFKYFKLIKTSEYDKMADKIESLEWDKKHLKDDKADLNKQIKAMNSLLSKERQINVAKAKENGCQVGAWCEDCEYAKSFRESYYKYNDVHTSTFPRERFCSVESGLFCTKHLHDICPEYKSKLNK